MNALARAAALAERTQDAYSFKRYGPSAWRMLCRVLLWNYAEREVEVLVRSKWARWASDVPGWRYGRGSGRRAAAYITRQLRERPNELSELMTGGDE
jgi:hypothetical protein